MDRDGLTREVYDSAANIDQGRKWLDTLGLESNGRSAYRLGLADAMKSFQTAQAYAANDLELLILAEQTFILQELQFCDSADTDAQSSLEQAARSFDDALRVLEVVEDSVLYEAVEKSYPAHRKYRYKSMPKDSFHIACIAHQTRINNIKRSPGINMAEKALLTQRSANMKTAQGVYLEKQKTALR